MVDVRFAIPEERAAVAQFMADAFPRAKWGMDGWTDLLANRWGAQDDPFAVVAVDADRIVGTLGLVVATRPTATGPSKTVNMSSWYVLKSHRGMGLGHKMIAMACDVPEGTVTNFTSSRGAVPVVQSAGLATLDDTRHTWFKRDVAGPLPVWRDGATGPYSTIDKQIIADHAGLNVSPVLVETPDGPCFFMIAERQKHDAYITHEVYHASHPARFTTHARAIADSLLPNAAALSVDARFLTDDVQSDAETPLAAPRFYSAGGLPRAQVDHLYSEVVLLKLKLG